ncbi:MAG TPA: beta-N-acetylhexosaminidase [Caproicibacter sp.]|nr:beta-N-acetylhexosaminidase [Caproicibacter sp.]
MTEMNLRLKIGQRLVTGLPGTELNDEFVDLVKEYKISNVILFDRNVESSSQLKKLCADIQKLVKEQTGHFAFISIDQEGGVVTRMPKDLYSMPGSMALAATGKPENAYTAGLITAKELRSLGINFNLAPVLDVNTNKNNPVIGVRSYGSTPDVVIKYGLEMIRGLTDGGVLCSAKHFPGHGDTDVDSHLDLPCVNKPMEDLERVEFYPFKAAIDAGIPSIMSTHILFPAIEKQKLPATMSRTIITDLLKGRLGFKGLVISDCLEMQAIQKFYGTANGAVAAAKAGIDLILISHTPSLVREAVAAIEKAIENGEISQKEMDESVEKILSYKATYADKKEEKLNCEEYRATVEKLIQESITLVNSPNGTIADLGEKPLFVGSISNRATVASSDVDKSLCFPKYMAEKFKCSYIQSAIDPDDNEIKEILGKTKGFSCIVFGTYNGNRNKGQVKLANALINTGMPTIVVSLRDPYDLGHIDKKASMLAAYEYSPRSFDAVANVLSGRKKATGRITVSL